MQQRERAVVELHRDAPHGLLRTFDGDLEELQDEGLVCAEHLTGGDTGKQAVADLTGSAGDGNTNRVLHGSTFPLGSSGAGRDVSRRSFLIRASATPLVPTAVGSLRSGFMS